MSSSNSCSPKAYAGIPFELKLGDTVIAVLEPHEADWLIQMAKRAGSARVPARSSVEARPAAGNHLSQSIEFAVSLRLVFTETATRQQRG